MTEFSDQIIIEPSVLELIDRCLRLKSQCFEPIPDQDRTRDMIPLNATDPALTAFNPGDLFGLAVKFLNLPAQVSRRLNNLHGGMSPVVGDNKGHFRFRVRGRPPQTEYTHVMPFRKIPQMDVFARELVVLSP